MSKHDLQARPIYHHNRESIEAHLSIVFAALAVSHWIEHQTGWSIKKFVRTARRYRTVHDQSRQTRPSPPPTRYPTTSATPSPRSAPAVCTKLSQVGLTRPDPARTEFCGQRLDHCGLGQGDETAGDRRLIVAEDPLQARRTTSSIGVPPRTPVKFPLRQGLSPRSLLGHLAAHTVVSRATVHRHTRDRNTGSASDRGTPRCYPQNLKTETSQQVIQSLGCASPRTGAVDLLVDRLFTPPRLRCC